MHSIGYSLISNGTVFGGHATYGDSMLNNATNLISNNEHILKEKVSIINGGSSEIGVAIIETLLENKAQVIATYHKRKNNLEHLIEKYSNSQLKIIQVDFLDRQWKQNIQKLVKQTKDQFNGTTS